MIVMLDVEGATSDHHSHQGADATKNEKPGVEAGMPEIIDSISLPPGITLRDLRRFAPITIPLIVHFSFRGQDTVTFQIGTEFYTLRCGVSYVLGSGGEENKMTYLNPLHHGSAADESNIPFALDDYLATPASRSAGIDVHVSASGQVIDELIQEYQETQVRRSQANEVLRAFEPYLYENGHRLTERRDTIINDVLVCEFPELASLEKGRGYVNSVLFSITWTAQALYLDSIDIGEHDVTIESCITESARRFFTFLNNVVLPQLKLLREAQSQGDTFSLVLNKYNYEYPSLSAQEGTAVMAALLSDAGTSICIPSGNCPVQAIAALDGLMQGHADNFPLLSASAKARSDAGQLRIDPETGFLTTTYEGLNLWEAVYHGDGPIEHCIQTLRASAHPGELISGFPHVVFKDVLKKEPDESKPREIKITWDDLR